MCFRYRFLCLYTHLDLAFNRHQYNVFYKIILSPENKRKICKNNSVRTAVFEMGHNLGLYYQKNFTNVFNLEYYL